MNTHKLNLVISEFIKKKKSNAAYYEENWAERKERKDTISLLPRTSLLL